MKLLQALTQTPSVPGREDRIRKVIQDYVTKQNLFDEITVDAMGSLIGVRRPRPEKGKASKKPIKVMLARTWIRLIPRPPHRRSWLFASESGRWLRCSEFVCAQSACLHNAG